MEAGDAWIDVTRPVSEALPVWPGDTPYVFELAWSQGDGASVNVGAIRSTVHLGTHVDAPFHFTPGGATVDALPLAAFCGEAWVVDARGKSLIGVDAVAHLPPEAVAAAPRLLLRTDGWPEGDPFPAQVPVVTPELVDWMARLGVVLLGVDVPSVDLIESTTLDNHRRLDAAGIQILEGLNLHSIQSGRYLLQALPLRLVGADASPVRALLRPSQACDALA